MPRLELQVINPVKFKCAGPNPLIYSVPENQRPHVSVFEHNNTRFMVCPKAEKLSDGRVMCNIFPSLPKDEMDTLLAESRRLDNEYRTEWSINMGAMTREPARFPIYEQMRKNGEEIFKHSIHACRPAYFDNIERFLASQDH